MHYGISLQLAPEKTEYFVIDSNAYARNYVIANQEKTNFFV